MFDRKVWYITIVVIIAERFHLFPYRTQKLSFLTPKVLVGTLTGRIGHRHFPSFCRLFDKNNRKYCSLAQSVEHRTVNPSVVSSSLTGAAIYVDRNYWFGQKRAKNVCFWLFLYVFCPFSRAISRATNLCWPCRFHCWFLAFFWKIKVWTYNIPILAIF